MNEWNAAIEEAIKAASAIPVYVDTDGSDPDAERSAVPFRNDAVDALRALLKPYRGGAVALTLW